ncbi:hypothetical protein NDU88_002450 [Pleurodeles waltl]|uniref:Uncharacterized protein n=1 Tax=Pleurodeles waltl TaxID=8319 RepID=A0AAV7REJ1_PLEWA|nr:hypothetical protein NDU88_002450 [Pleurodeles waltl]
MYPGGMTIKETPQEAGNFRRHDLQDRHAMSEKEEEDAEIESSWNISGGSNTLEIASRTIRRPKRRSSLDTPRKEKKDLEEE